MSVATASRGFAGDVLACTPVFGRPLILQECSVDVVRVVAGSARVWSRDGNVMVLGAPYALVAVKRGERWFLYLVTEDNSAFVGVLPEWFEARDFCRVLVERGKGG